MGTASDTIVAVATAPGRGALGIVRASGSSVPRLIEAVTGNLPPPPRYASLRTFYGDDGAPLDTGLVIRFAAPASFTGEDLCEFHAHGNPHILQALIDTLCANGARQARPGEFTERAFRNGKLDLAQAEAVADIIAGQSLRAARSALRSLRGEFSRQIDIIVTALTNTRVALEGSIDFPDDISSEDLERREFPRVVEIRQHLATLTARAHHGARLANGTTIVIVGEPNVGKSTLLNNLCGLDRAIVSATPGTTRDTVEVDMEIRGVPIRLCDTAGLRDAGEEIEREGMRRAIAAMKAADLLLVMTDDLAPRSPETLLASLGDFPASLPPAIVVHNKIDNHCRPPARVAVDGVLHVYIAARQAIGVDLLISAIRSSLDLEDSAENEFAARRRHLTALQQARHELDSVTLDLCRRSPELAAEALRRAADYLSSITGTGGSEALLGEIFARFCIGK